MQKSLPNNGTKISDTAHKTQVQDFEVNWKSALTLAICKSDSAIRSERLWASMLETIRHLCPETKWLSICDDQFTDKDEKIIQSIFAWLKALVISPDWGFPENVIFISSNETTRHWKIIFSSKDLKLPYVVPPQNITVIPWRDKHSSGWKIIPLESFNSKNVGEV